MDARRLSRILRNRWHANLAHPLASGLRRALRPYRIRRYLRSTPAPALILGAGSQRRAGWLASDLDPGNWTVIPLDATKPLPFAEGALAYVFAEHMIEHIDYADAENLTREIFRVLRPGGILRIATPDLQRLARLIVEPLDAAAQSYVDWHNETFGGHRGNRASFVVNRAMRWWGHRFVYDMPTLQELLTGAGFVALETPDVGESRHAALRGIEHHGDVVSERANRFETMVVEAAKPGP